MHRFHGGFDHQAYGVVDVVHAGGTGGGIFGIHAEYVTRLVDGQLFQQFFRYMQAEIGVGFLQYLAGIIQISGSQAVET